MTRVDAVAEPTSDLFAMSGKVVWITGAGRGIGRALAVGLAHAGARLAVTARSADTLHALTDELPGHDVLPLPGNVVDGSLMEATAAEIVDAYGSIDVLVNAAGVSPSVRASETIHDDEWRHVVNINLDGTFYCCRAAARRMLAAGAGSIVNISSAHGSTGVARMAAYGASKGAVENLTRCLALEWAGQGVRVNCVAPGYIDTDMTNSYLRSSFGERVRADIPMGQPGLAVDVVGAVRFLCSDASAYVTGAIVPVDGGWTAR